MGNVFLTLVSHNDITILLTLFPLCTLWRNEGKVIDILIATKLVRVRPYMSLFSEHYPHDIASSLYSENVYAPTVY